MSLTHLCATFVSRDASPGFASAPLTFTTERIVGSPQTRTVAVFDPGDRTDQIRGLKTFRMRTRSIQTGQEGDDRGVDDFDTR